MNEKIDQIEIASTFWQRLVGLMNKKNLPANYGMLFTPCSRVHTCFMKIPICVLFLDERWNVLDAEVLKPWSIAKRVEGTCHIIETSAEFGSDNKKGRLILEFEEDKNVESI